MLGLFLFSATGVQALTFAELEPAWAEVGEEVKLTGVGFDQPPGNYTVTVSGLNAVVVEVQAGFIRFAVPAGAISGPVAVDDGTDPGPLVHRTSLSVTRAVNATFAASIPFSTSQYAIDTIYGESEDVGPDFSIDIVTGEPTMVMASNLESEPSFIAFTTDSTVGVELGAESTAVALIFMMPTIFTADLVEADSRLAAIGPLAETQALTGLIQANLAAGTDYLEDPAFDDTYIAATLASDSAISAAASFGASLTPAESGQGVGEKDDYVNTALNFASGTPPYPRDLDEPGWASKLDRLSVAKTDPGFSDQGLPTLGFKYSPNPMEVLFGIEVDQNPLAWAANVYELRTTSLDLPKDKAYVDAMGNGSDYLATYLRTNPEPVERQIIKASSAVKKIDVFERLIDYAAGKVVSETLGSTPSDLMVPADRAGLYVVRKFSGAYFPPQDTLIDNLDGGWHEAHKMTGVNAFLSVIDLLGMFLKSEDVIGKKEFYKTILSLELALGKSLAKNAGNGAYDGSTVWIIIKETAKAGAKIMIKKLLDPKTYQSKANKKAPLKGFAGLAKTALKVINVVGKVVKATTAAERVIALTNVFGAENANVIQAVESSVVIVGDPWRPEITSFSPRRGYRGSRVVLRGRNFASDNKDDNVVTFKDGPSTSPDPTPPAATRAEIIWATSTAMAVLVPEDGCSGTCFIEITVAGKGVSSTHRLAYPYHSYNVVENPVLTSFEPGVPLNGRFLKVNGQNLLPEYIGRMSIEKNGSEVYGGSPVHVGPDAFSVFAPYHDGTPAAFNLLISLEEGGELRSNTLSYAPVEPPYEGYGTSIGASSSLDNTDADEVITLREAIGWASGTLARAPTRCPDGSTNDECNKNLTECGHISGCYSGAKMGEDYGAGFRDTIHYQPGEGTVLELGSALPPFGSEDWYTLGGTIIDGTAVAGDAIRLIDVDNLFVSNATFRNFGGNGIHISGNSSGNDFRQLFFENCEGHGVFLEGNANTNYFFQVEAYDSGGDGLRVEGNSSFNDFWRNYYIRSGGDGVHFIGAGVQFNYLSYATLIQVGAYLNPSLINVGANTGWGIHIEGGSSYNLILSGGVEGNGLGGIRVGTGSPFNRIGTSENLEPEWGWQPGEYYAIRNNTGGPGISIASSHTTVRTLHIYGNQGDGIVVGEPDVASAGAGAAVALPGDITDIQIFDVRVGYDDDGVAAANQGAGIHFKGQVSESTIGYLLASTTPYAPDRNYIGGNTGHGIWLEGAGVHDITVTRSIIGSSDIPVTGVTGVLSLMPNGQGGVAVTGGSYSNDIYGISIFGHANGAAILLSGAGTKDNRVSGVMISSHGPYIVPLAHYYRNRYGIRITDGAHANIIGPRNWIEAGIEANILLESGGALPGGSTTGGPLTPVGANVIKGNVIGNTGLPGPIGIHLKGGAIANRIGGEEAAEGNDITATTAGIHIDSVVITRPDLSNRIIGNTISGTYDEAATASPLSTVPPGVAILVTGGSGHIIGGASYEGNVLEESNVGLYINGSSDVKVRGNYLGSDSAPSNRLAGAIVRDCIACEIGPGNRVLNNGSVAGLYELGGIAIGGGSGNQVFGNWIGMNPFDPTLQANGPYGVALFDSPNNTIGGVGLNKANYIVGTLGDGILIDGVPSVDNRLGNNFIGLGPNPGWALPNTRHGVYIRGGAAANTVGGELPHKVQNTIIQVGVQNTISGNGGDGVRVEGGAQNSILNNSIYGHGAGLGINNVGGGNTELTPPVITLVAGSEVSGTVAAPDGSRVQVFTDDGDEGRSFFGEATVYSGAFSIPAGLKTYRNLTSTVTDLQENTSEFGGTQLLDPPALDIRRTNNPPGVGTAGVGVIDVPILPVTVKSLGDPVTVQSMTFKASGPLDDTLVTAVNLYRDYDEDGQVSEGDTLLGGPGTHDANDGTVTIDLTRANVDSAPQEWLLTYTLSPAAPLSTSFTTEITNAAMVSAVAFFGPPVSPTGPFPVVSDEFTTTISSFALDVITDGNGTGTVTSAPAGIDCGVDCTESYVLNTGVTLSASPFVNSVFTGWSGAGCAGTGDCIVTMDGVKEVKATFTLIKRTLTVAKDGAGVGTVISTPAGIDCGGTCTADFEHATVVNLTPMPDPGSGFDDWSGDPDCSDGSLNMTDDRSCTATFRINAAPVANPGGPYNANEGSTAQLDGSASTDSDGTVVSYEWDMDNNGSYETAGNPATFDATAKDGPSGPFTVGLRVTDNDGGTNTAQATISVDNVAPAAVPGGPYVERPNVVVYLNGSVTDPAPADTHTYAWDLDNNGSYETAGQDAQVSFPAEGTYIVGLEVTDDDDGVGTETVEIVIDSCPGSDDESCIFQDSFE